mgnify:CR=1 FL=1
MTKRIDSDAKVNVNLRIKHGLRQEIDSLFTKSTCKRKCHFYEMLLRDGLSQYKEGKDASSS